MIRCQTPITCKEQNPCPCLALGRGGQGSRWLLAILTQIPGNPVKVANFLSNLSAPHDAG